MSGEPWSDTVTLRLGGHRYAFGLDWRSPPDDSIRKAALDAVTASPGSLAALRPARRQYGLGAASAGGAIAAAAALADGRPGAWIGVCALPDASFWGVAARHGTLYPTFGDLRLANAAEARAWLQQHVTAAAWDHVFAPAGWPGATEAPANLEALFARRRPGPVLRDPHGLPLGRLALIVGAVVTLATAALIAHDLWFDQPPPRVAATETAPDSGKLPPLPLPQSVPAGSAVLACLDAFDNAAAADLPAGWESGRFRCNVELNGVNAVLQLQAPDWMPLALLPPSDALALDLERRQGRITRWRRLAGARRIASRPARPAIRDLARLAETLGGRLGAGLAIARVQPSLDPAVHAQPDWAQLDWTFTTTAPPALWLAGLAGLAPVVMRSVERDADQQTWRLSGWTATENSDD